MTYKLLADAVVFIHFLWILFLVLGAFMGVRHRPFRIAHISGLSFAVFIQLFGWYCPLTHLEVWLRGRHDPALSYSGSFIIHYVERIIYIQLSPGLILVLSLLLCLVNGWVYLRRGT